MAQKTAAMQSYPLSEIQVFMLLEPRHLGFS